MLFMIACVGLLTLMDGTAKYLTRDYPIWQVVWARYAFNLLGLVALRPLFGRLAVKSRAPWLQLARGLAMVVATWLMFLSLHLLPMAETYAIAFLSPVFVALLAGLVLRERVDRHRWLAALGGFIGVLVVIRPGSALFGLAALAPIGMALAYASYQLITRVLGRHDPITLTMLWSASVGTILSSVVLPWQWNWPDAYGWLLMAAMGLLGLAGQLAMIQAFSLAPASAISPFIYTQILWAVLFGFLVFGDLPDHWTLVGAAIVITSGLYLFHIEKRRSARGS